MIEESDGFAKLRRASRTLFGSDGKASLTGIDRFIMMQVSTPGVSYSIKSTHGVG